MAHCKEAHIPETVELDPEMQIAFYTNQLLYGDSVEQRRTALGWILKAFNHVNFTIFLNNNNSPNNESSDSVQLEIIQSDVGEKSLQEKVEPLISHKPTESQLGENVLFTQINTNDYHYENLLDTEQILHNKLDQMPSPSDKINKNPSAIILDHSAPIFSTKLSKEAKMPAKIGRKRNADSTGKTDKQNSYQKRIQKEIANGTVDEYRARLNAASKKNREKRKKMGL